MAASLDFLNAAQMQALGQAGPATSQAPYQERASSFSCLEGLGRMAGFRGPEVPETMLDDIATDSVETALHQNHTADEPADA